MEGVALDPGEVLAWAGPRLRELPWRATRDPWPILVAEVMLQQTQTNRVIPKWLAFRAAYPDPAACARATLGDVLRAWQGLGYPRRARNLHDAAQAIVARHAGTVPRGLDALLALPGVGRYTARAIAVFAFEQDEAVVDTNIARLLARVHGARLSAAGVQTFADSLVPRGAAWLWNQGLMDLGATVCRPVPRCGECPVAADCRWHRRGHPDPDPANRSAGVSTRQPPYAGSDRERRGYVLRALQHGPRSAAAFLPRIVDGLIADRLVVRDGDDVQLP